MVERRKIIIFDFDGVLNNSFEELFKMHVFCCSQFGREISALDYSNLFLDANCHNNLEKFLALEPRKLEEFKTLKYSVYNDYYSQTKLFDFAKELINKLKLAGYNNMAIVSSAPKNQIEKILEINDLRSPFFEILGINKNGKSDVITSLVENLNLQPSDCYFITDTVGDVIDGKNARVNVLAVTWGFHDMVKLTAAGPRNVVVSPQEIFDILI